MVGRASAYFNCPVLVNLDLVTGLDRAAKLDERRAYGVIAIGVMLIAIPLSRASVRVARDSIAQMRVTDIANNWARQYSTDSVVRSVLASGSRAKILFTGSEQPSTVEDLGAQIKSEVEWVAEVDLRFVPSRAVN